MNAGTQIAHYKIISALGKGGMGEVYLADDTKLDRQVAIKVLPDAVRQDPERLARFRREAKAAASLNHPNIATIHSIEEADNVLFIVMEYVDGETLSERIPPDGMDLDVFFSTFIPLADALAHAHQQGRVHRDLKPANIMVAEDGTPKILDFGLARIMPVAEEPEEADQLGSQDETRTLDANKLNQPVKPPTDPSAMSPGPKLMGTPQYMSPEQAESETLDHRTDIFSFGVVMYEALTGRKAFEGSSRASLLGRIINENPEPVTSLKPITPYQLWLAIDRCLRKNRAVRTQTALELFTDLEGVKKDVEAGMVLVDANTIPVSEPVSEPAVPVQVPFWRQTTGIAALALVALLIGLTTSWFLKPGPSPRPRTFTLAMEAVVWRFDAPVLSPDGTMIVYTKTLSGPLWIRDLITETDRELAGTDGGEHPFWSPDSRTVGYIKNASNDQNGGLRTVSVQGGPSTPLADLPAGASPRGAVWLDDGRILLGVTDAASQLNPGAGSASLYQVLAGGGTMEVFLAPDTTRAERSITYPFLLPGGTPAFCITDTAGAGSIVMLSGQDRVTLIQHPGETLTHPLYAPSGYIIYQRSSFEGGIMPVSTSLWVLPVDGNRASGPSSLLFNAALIPSGSSDGTLLYSKSPATAVQNLNRLVWSNRSGTVLESIGRPQANFIMPVLAPDDSRVAVQASEQGNFDIWNYDTERGTDTRLTFDGGFDGTPAWSPDGNEVVFQSRRNGNPDLFRRHADGSGVVASLLTSPAIEVSPHWSRQYVVYMSGEIGSFDIWAFEPGGDGEPFALVAAEHQEANPALSPDARYVAYDSNESGRYEVYVMRFPSGQGRWQVSSEGGVRPRWNGDGTELFFVSGDNMMAVEVSTRSVFRRGIPKTLFSGSSANLSLPIYYDVSADGQRFVVVQQAAPKEQTRSTVWLVQDWAARFRELQ